MLNKFVLILVVALLSWGFVVSAQEATPTPDMATLEPTAEVTPAPEPTPAPDPDPAPPLPDEPPIATPGDILERLFDVLKGTYIAWAAAGTLVIVGLIKAVAARFLGVVIEGRGAALLAVFIQVLIWALYNIAQYFGAAEQFQSIYLGLVEILKSLLPFVVGLFVTKEAYHLARKRDVPLVGYKPAHKAQVTQVG